MSNGPREVGNRGIAAGAIANYGALALAAAAGLIVNAIIAWHYSVETLGVFNQVFAVYIVSSQLGVAGIHLAILSLASREGMDAAVRQEIVASSLAAVCLTGTACAIVLSAVAPLIARVLGSPDVANGLRIAALALPLIGLNKCFQAGFTATGRLQHVALLQAARAFGLLVAALVCAMLGVAGTALASAFVMAELLVLAVAVATWRERPKGAGLALSHARAVRMLELAGFGARSLIGSTLQELNIRIDLLVIGLLLDDRDVGIYSFAGLVAEGMLAAIAVVRNMMVPSLATALAAPGRAGLPALVGTVYRWTYSGAFITAIAAVAGTWLALRVLYGDTTVYLQAIPLLAILLTGTVLVAGILALDFVFIIGGRPGLHSLVVALGVAVNIVLNLMLIPYWGLTGAALATAIATVVTGIAIVSLAWLRLRVRLVPGPRE